MEAPNLGAVSHNPYLDMEKNPIIRPVKKQDSEAIAEIYNYYILNSVITFEEDAVSTREIQTRIDAVVGAGLPWLVAEESGKILGYCYAGQWQSRGAYRATVEFSAYLDQEQTGRGLGSQLLGSLYERLEANPGVHVVIGGTVLPNDPSVALQEKFGARKVAHYREVGFKFGRWLDVGYWQRILDR